MWIPRTEEDIVDAVNQVSLAETGTFDAKREIPPKNAETAKDVSAMANSAGGVLLYGVGEDQNRRLTILNPNLLSGQPERIEQIIRTSIDEVPNFNLISIPTKSDPTLGYILVIVPPSDRAPHMVIIKGERRYYGRGETGNYTLSQIEIARLYERRIQTSEGIRLLLDEHISKPPIQRDDRYTHLHVVARPVLREEPILSRALSSNQEYRDLLRNLVDHVSQSVNIGGSYTPDFTQPVGWTREADGFLGKLRSASENDPRPSAHTLHLKVNFDGGASLFCGRAAEDGERADYPLKYFFADLVAGNTTKFLAMLGELYRRAIYFGMVEIGVGLVGLQRAIPFETRSRFDWYPRYEGNDAYQKTKRASATALQVEPEKTAEELLMPVIDAIFEETYDPFNPERT